MAVRPLPGYTDLAQRARVSGIVVLDCLVRKDGTASVMGIVEGLGFGLDESAQSVVAEQWRFNPAMRDGQPVDVRLYMEITFNLR
jgi:protein TonB